jgi:molybdopterin-guanine dinucleotide biosynthesis protein
MTTIVVGGHSRKVGKTSVAAALIAAFPRYPWTAIKISSHWHDDASDVCAVHEESDRTGKTDTSRFLAAGATRSLWVCVRENEWETAIQRLLPILQSSPFLIIESNRILQHIRPDLYILVLRYDVEDFKVSARDSFSQAHAVVAVHTCARQPAWKGILNGARAGIPVFTVEDPSEIPSGLLDLVRSRLPVEP